MWFLLAVLAAFCQSATDTLGKRLLLRRDPYVVAWGAAFASFLILSPLLHFADIPASGSGFWQGLLIASLIDAITLCLYMKALKTTELSLVVPLQMFTPLVLIVSSPLLLGEIPSAHGLLGVLLIIAGSYVLNIKACNQGLASPFRALLEKRGARIMLFCALLWGLNINIHKICILNSSPLFYALAHQAGISLFLLPVFLKCLLKDRHRVLKALPKLGIQGMLLGVTVLLTMSAMGQGLVVYAISVKRTSVIFSICIGCLFFRELDLRPKLAGASIMFIGAILTSF